MIRQAVLDAWIPFNTGKLTWMADDGTEKRSPNEGLVLPSYMYEDILGLVTTGMGNRRRISAVKAARVMPLVRRSARTSR